MICDWNEWSFYNLEIGNEWGEWNEWGELMTDLKMEFTDLWRCLKHEVTLFYTGTFIGEVRPQSIDRLVDEYVWDIDEYMDMDINNKIANPTDAKLATMV